MPKSPSIPELSQRWLKAWVRVKSVVGSRVLITWSHTRVSLVPSQERTRPDTSLLLSRVLWRLAYECGGYERKDNSLDRLALNYLRLICIIFTKRQLNMICFFFSYSDFRRAAETSSASHSNCDCILQKVLCPKLVEMYWSTSSCSNLCLLSFKSWRIWSYFK